MQKRSSVTIDDRQIERLGVDVEPVLAQPDDTWPAFKKFLPILQLTRGFLLGGLQSPLEIVRLDRVSEFEQLPDRLTHPRDHEIGGDVSVDLLDRGKPREPAADDLQNPLARAHECAGLAIALFDEGDLALLEGLVKFRAPFAELNDVLLEIREAALELLDLDTDPVQILVALGRRFAQVQVTGRRLAQQLQLRAELRRALGGDQFVEALF